MLVFFRPSPKLEVAPEQKVTFVYPSPRPGLEGDEPEPSVARGVVTLSRPAAGKVKAFTVLLKGISELHAGSGRGTETTIVFERTENVRLEGNILEVGDHVFPFAFSIPAPTACSVFGPLERVFYTVTASVTFEGNTVSSPPVRVWIVALPTDPGDVPDSFLVNHEHLGEHLGPTRMTIFSPHLTIGTLIHLRLFSASTPTPLHILAVRVFLTQSAVVNSRGGRQVLPPSPCNLFHVKIKGGRAPYLLDIDKMDVKLASGGAWKYNATLRMPECGAARPTTVAGSHAKIVVSNTLSVEIQYRVGGLSQVNVSTLALPVVVGPCTSLIESLVLPEYVRAPPKKQYSALGVRDGVSL